VSGTFTVFFLSAFGVAAWRVWPEIVAGITQVSPFIFVVSSLGMVFMVLAMGVLWREVLAVLGVGRPALRPVMFAQIVSWLGRYVPGKFGQVLGKFWFGRSLGIESRDIAFSLWLEGVFVLGSGAMVVAACLGSSAATIVGLETNRVSKWAVIACVLAACSAVIWISFFLVRQFAKRRQSTSLQGMNMPAVGLLFLGYAFAHVCAGLGFFMLLSSMHTGPTEISVWNAVGILTAAHLAGIAAVVAPAGLGPREAAMTLLLAPTMGTAPAMTVAVVTRIWATLADIMLVLPLPLMAWPPRAAGSSGVVAGDITRNQRQGS
jgi:uncharacterized membrane protein YbhN (UPF0104 family)